MRKKLIFPILLAVLGTLVIVFRDPITELLTPQDNPLMHIADVILFFTTFGVLAVFAITVRSDFWPLMIFGSLLIRILFFFAVNPIMNDDVYMVIITGICVIADAVLLFGQIWSSPYKKDKQIVIVK